jgi:anti-sigma regulatory factor (Ser/Thr protein kinase)
MDETAAADSPRRGFEAPEQSVEAQTSIALGAVPASSHAARNFVGATLDRWGRGDLVEVAVLLTSELVTNAIIHAGTDLVVTVRREGDRARVAVHDEEITPPRRREPGLDGGRGLALVEALAGAWGTFPRGEGKAVWFEL